MLHMSITALCVLLASRFYSKVLVLRFVRLVMHQQLLEEIGVCYFF